MAERPENIFVCPDCGGKYKTVKQDVEQMHFGKIVKIHNVPFAVCNGTSRTPGGCGRPPEIIDQRVSKRIFELARDCAKHSEETNVFYNEHYSD